MKAKARIIVWIIMLFGGASLSFFLDKKFFPTLLSSPVFHAITFLAGLIMLKAVITISKVTGRTLAKYGRQGDIPRMETNRLVTQGVYSKMRHPMHLGLMFFPLSIALLLGLPSFIFFIAPAEMLFILAMVFLVEEPEAKRKFGQAYEQYSKEVPRFCLRPDCLKALFTLSE